MEDGYEYGGGGPEYMLDGLANGGAGILVVVGRDTLEL